MITLKHRAIESFVFQLIGTYELDINLEEYEDQFPLRIELFQALSDNKLFRCRIWRYECFRIQSAFPRDYSGTPEHEPSDEMILVRFSQPHLMYRNDFSAENSEEAFDKIIYDVGRFLTHVTLEEPQFITREVEG